MVGLSVAHAARRWPEQPCAGERYTSPKVAERVRATPTM